MDASKIIETPEGGGTTLHFAQRRKEERDYYNTRAINFYLITNILIRLVRQLRVWLRTMTFK